MVRSNGKRKDTLSSGRVSRLKTALLAFFAALVFMLPSSAFSREATVIQSEGVTAKSEDITEVKRKALDKALRSAVMESAKAILAKEGLKAPAAGLEQLASSPRAFVLNYKIRSEGWVTHLDAAPQTPSPEPSATSGAEFYHIWIDASIDTDALKSAVSKLASAGGVVEQVVINLMDIKDYQTFRLLVDSLQRIAFIKEVSYSSFTNGRITLSAAIAGDASSLAGRIAKEVPEKFAVMEGAGQIIIRPSGTSRR